MSETEIENKNSLFSFIDICFLKGLECLIGY